MMAKLILLFLIIMIVIAFWGRWSTRPATRKYCGNCGRLKPCACNGGNG